jgi:hypothetical protein
MSLEDKMKKTTQLGVPKNVLEDMVTGEEAMMKKRTQ